MLQKILVYLFGFAGGVFIAASLANRFNWNSWGAAGGAAFAFGLGIFLTVVGLFISIIPPEDF